MIEFTEKTLNSGKSRNGQWGLAQLKVLGIPEFKKGWKKKVIGKKYSVSDIAKFLELKNKHLDKYNAISSPRIEYMDSPDYKADYPIQEQYKNPKWLELRDIILKRDHFSCKLCKTKKGELHVHHLKYQKNRYVWEVETKFLVTFCKICHEEWHRKKMD